MNEQQPEIDAGKIDWHNQTWVCPACEHVCSLDCIRCPECDYDAQPFVDQLAETMIVFYPPFAEEKDKSE